MVSFKKNSRSIKTHEVGPLGNFKRTTSRLRTGHTL
jgi:hypothetical protein